MKKIKKLCVAVLCFSLLCSVTFMPNRVSAAGDNTQISMPWMVYISLYSGELEISSSGLATCIGEVRGKNNVTTTSVTVKLQRYINGDWYNYKIWSETNQDIITVIAETYQVMPGTYRVEMTCSANTETKTYITPSQTYAVSP